jgi:hypothetical protein
MLEETRRTMNINIGAIIAEANLKADTSNIVMRSMMVNFLNRSFRASIESFNSYNHGGKEVRVEAF